MLIIAAPPMSNDLSAANAPATGNAMTAIATMTSLAVKTADGDNGRLAQNASVRVGESICNRNAVAVSPRTTMTAGRKTTKASRIPRTSVVDEVQYGPRAWPVTTL